MMNEKEVTYQTTNTYSTLNSFGPETENVWVVFHGIGYLSRYFLKYFRHLNPRKNYIIAPQAPSKYYLNGKYEHVGASWATRENTEREIQNLMAFLDEIYKKEDLKDASNLILFGYSQGVSIVSRWVGRKKVSCSHLILHSGKLPKELSSGDFVFLKEARISFVYGTEDGYLDPETLKTEVKRITEIFGEKASIIPFDGGHEVNKDLITKFAEEQ